MLGVDSEYCVVRKLRCPETDFLIEELWENSEGLPHNQDGPAVRTWNPQSGVLLSSAYYRTGYLHRTDGKPAMEEFDELGRCIFRSFAVDGEYFRENDRPHVEFLDPETGGIARVEYRINGRQRPLLHRTEGPAVIIFNPLNGHPIAEEFFQNGKPMASQAPPALEID